MLDCEKPCEKNLGGKSMKTKKCENVRVFKEYKIYLVVVV